MAKIELGTKRVCVSCGARFYDLTKVPAVCPKCGTEQPIEQPRPRRTGGNVVEERRPKKPVPAPGLEEADVEVEGVEEEGEEALIEDADDLEDDADTIVPEIEVEPIPTRPSGSAYTAAPAGWCQRPSALIAAVTCRAGVPARRPRRGRANALPQTPASDSTAVS